VAVVIGSSTAVTLEFPGQVINTGLVSIDWSFSANIQRLYTLGMGIGDCGPLEYANIRDSQVSVNFSIYGGETPSLDICPPSEGCEDSPAKIIVTIVPGVCGSLAAEGLNARAVYINSYSYSKDRTSFGTEQWSGSAYVVPEAPPGGSVPEYVTPEPTANILGIAEGTIEAEDSDFTTLQAITGATFRDTNAVVTVAKGSVQAGATSVGDYTLTHNGTFQSVGNSQFWADGVLARASVTLNLQPVYYTE